MFHTGLRKMFPLNWGAVSRLIPPERLRWIAFGHFEADECGAMNEWLAVAPQATPAHGVDKIAIFPPDGIALGMPHGSTSTHIDHDVMVSQLDRKTVDVSGTTVNLLLWDVEGRTADHDIPTSYLRGAHAMFYVADGTRRDTFDQIFDLREHARSAAGDVPSIVALNKVDLKEQWLLTPAGAAR